MEGVHYEQESYVMNEYIVFTDIDECVEDPALCGGVDGEPEWKECIVNKRVML